MTRIVLSGFAIGALLGVYANYAGVDKALLVLVFGLIGAGLTAGGTVVAKLDRRRLLDLFGDSEG